jgi:WD40 repeat protein
MRTRIVQGALLTVALVAPGSFAAAPGRVVRIERDEKRKEPFSPARFSKDGRLLATVGAGGSLSVCDVRTGKVRLRAGTIFREDTAALAPDSKSLAAFMRDRTLCLWGLATGRPLFRLRAKQHGIASVTYAPGGRVVAIATGDGAIQVRDTATGKPRFAVPARCHSTLPAAFSPDGTVLVTVGTDGVLRVWDLQQGSCTFTITQFRRGAFSPDGRHLLVHCARNTMCLLEVRSRKVRPLPCGKVAYTSAEFSPDSRTLATLDGDGILRLWDPATGKATATFAGADEGHLSIDLAPGGKNASHWETDDATLVSDIAVTK